MTKPLLDAELWAMIESLLPKPKPRRKRFLGREQISNRQALTRILFVLKTGIPWEYLPQELGCGSGMTCWRRLREWQSAGVWQRIYKRLLTKLRQAEQIDWSRAVVDSASVRAPRRGKARTPASPSETSVGRSRLRSEAHRKTLRKRGITPAIAKRNTAHESGLSVHRWVVERTIAWPHQNRRLRIRY